MRLDGIFDNILEIFRPLNLLMLVKLRYCIKSSDYSESDLCIV